MNSDGIMTVKNSTIIVVDVSSVSSINVKKGNVVLENVKLIAETRNQSFAETTESSTPDPKGNVFYEPQCLKVANGSVIANNCTFESKLSDAYAIAGMENSTIELNNCTVEAYRGGVHAAESSTIMINVGKYTQARMESSGHLFFAKGTIIIYSNTEKNPGASLQATSGNGEIIFK